jgi:hypothetical protein
MPDQSIQDTIADFKARGILNEAGELATPAEREEAILDRLIQTPTLARFFGGATSFRKAAEGLHGATARALADRLSDLVVSLSPQVPLTDEKTMAVVADALAAEWADLPQEGIGSPSEIDNPAEWGTYALADAEMGRDLNDPSDLDSEQKALAAGATYRDALLRATGETPAQHEARCTPPEPTLCTPDYNPNAGDDRDEEIYDADGNPLSDFQRIFGALEEGKGTAAG